jgi:hypothetical protein
VKSAGADATECGSRASPHVSAPTPEGHLSSFIKNESWRLAELITEAVQAAAHTLEGLSSCVSSKTDTDSFIPMGSTSVIQPMAGQRTKRKIASVLNRYRFFLSSVL